MLFKGVTTFSSTSILGIIFVLSLQFFGICAAKRNDVNIYDSWFNDYLLMIIYYLSQKQCIAKQWPKSKLRNQYNPVGKCLYFCMLVSVQSKATPTYTSSQWGKSENLTFIKVLHTVPRFHFIRYLVLNEQQNVTLGF